MKRVLLAAAVLCVATGASVTTRAAQVRKAVVGVTPEQVRWFAPTYYKDGRQRAQLYGDSSQGGVWVDRVKIPAGGRVLAHTHPHDELVTVLEGTWYLGEGARFDPAKLTAYPAGSFIVVPAGVPHFVAATTGAVIVQVGGVDTFGTDYLEK